MQEYFGFAVSRVLPEVLYWFRGQLEWMCDYDILEQHGYVLAMEGPRTKRRRSPEGDATTDEIVVKAQRIGRPPGAAPESLGRVMEFEFASDGSSTRVWARYAKGYAAIQVLFEDFLRQIEEHYPGVGPLCQQYRARQEQQHLERIEKHLRMEAAGVTTETEGGSGTEIGERKAEAHPQVADGTASKARAQPGRPRIEANEWARREVHIVGKAPREVFSEWCRRYAAETNQRVADLADPKDTFNKVLKRRPK